MARAYKEPGAKALPFSKQIQWAKAHCSHPVCKGNLFVFCEEKPLAIFAKQVAPYKEKLPSLKEPGISARNGSTDAIHAAPV